MVVLDFIVRVMIIGVVGYGVFIDKDFINELKDLFKF